MARRYGPDGQRLWDGKTPEEFTASDTLRFINETNNLIESEDFKKMPTATQTSAPARDVDSVAIEARAYPLRVPQGNVVANANVSIDGLVAIRNIQILSGENGLFVRMPREKDGAGQYKDVAYPIMKGLRARINEAVMDNLVAQLDRTEPEKPPIGEQLAKAAKEAARANAARPAPDRGAPARAERE